VDQLKELLQNLWVRIVTLLKSFENSSIFERIMRRYESLTPSGQRLALNLSKIGSLILIAAMFLGGPLILLYKIQKVQKLEKLEMDVLTFQAEYEAKTKGFSFPSGWRPMSSNSAQDLARSMTEYMDSIGVPEEYGSITATGDNLKLTAREVSIRQTTNMLFQMEALYPKLRGVEFSARPNTRNKEIIDLEASFIFNPQIVSRQQVPQDNINLPDEIFPEDNFQAPPPPPQSARPAAPSFPDRPSDQDFNPNSGFQEDYVPPPPPPFDDYEEFIPPEIPDDLPPPPPPPGFEDEYLE
jgi:hypothetical protein